MLPTSTLVLRIVAVGTAILAGAGAAALYLQYSSVVGLTPWAFISAIFLTLSTAYLAWGAMLSLIGLWPGPAPTRSDAPITGRTAVLMPVYNEEAGPTFARVAAMFESLRNAPAHIDFAILSDSTQPDRIAEEKVWFGKLLEKTGGAGRIFYRHREKNTGRKAGNITDFFRRSGGAYDYALILDADSLMEADTILEMIRRIEANPRIGLLQTLPSVVRGQSIFGRAMQFSAGFYSPVFARGLARLQGPMGTFWGHNAIVRTRAWIESCGLPDLPGKPPFGGHILSHDVVEAALLARNGWEVRLANDLLGSFEEGPESMIEYAKRDRRWCQGNLQHAKILGARGLKGWSRLQLFLGIASYVAPLFWAGFLITTGIDRATLPPPDYFPDPHQFFPVFPATETAKAIGLAIGIIGLLVMPKFLIVIEAALTGRSKHFGGTGNSFVSMLLDLLLSSCMAPIMMAFQSRSVIQVISGTDGGWPPQRRGDAALSVYEAWENCRFIPVIGILAFLAARSFVPGLIVWLLPVIVPMILSPLLISWTSQRSRPTRIFRIPEETDEPAVLRRHDALVDDWTKPANDDKAPMKGALANA